MPAKENKAKIGVLGASGYTGAELLRLLIRHPRAEIVLLTADRRAGKTMADVFPQFAPYSLPALTSIDAANWKEIRLDLAFCALPPGTTQKVIAELLARAPRTKVVDLSADFRIRDVAEWERWYKMKHGAPELLREAVRTHPANLRARLYLADSLAEDGKREEARQLVQGILDANEGADPPEDRRVKGYAREWLGRR